MWFGRVLSWVLRYTCASRVIVLIEILNGSKNEFLNKCFIKDLSVCKGGNNGRLYFLRNLL